ncbi:MAG: hypothetical protein AAFV07_03845 [Bacteroidota bacterium]
MLLWITGQIQLPDGGPRYTETDLSQWIVEPWNGVSAIIFLGIVMYWAFKLRGQFRQYLFLGISTVVLGIGGLGGTIYHLFRVSAVYLYMDWVPILLLCMATSIYFFILGMGGKWHLPVIIWVLVAGSQVVMFNMDWIPERYAVNINYATMALMVLIPTFLVLRRFHLKGWYWIVLALVAFCLALFFRIADPWGWLPMGTHFLWHVFGAIACGAMFQYVYVLDTLRLEENAS